MTIPYLFPCQRQDSCISSAWKGWLGSVRSP